MPATTDCPAYRDGLTAEIVHEVRCVHEVVLEMPTAEVVHGLCFGDADGLPNDAEAARPDRAGHLPG